MKALVLADNKPSQPLVELAQGCDIIITLGDLFYSDLEELKDVDLPKIGVHGNHDFYGRQNLEHKEFFADLGIKNLHLTKFECKGLTFGGFEFDMAYVFAENDWPYLDTDLNKYKTELAKLRSFPAVDVFITHAPSLGMFDIPHTLGHKGLKAFRDYIERAKPRFHFHGHVHKAQTGTIGQTKVYSVFPYLIVDLD